jgi:hypothetical protein
MAFSFLPLVKKGQYRHQEALPLTYYLVTANKSSN